MNISIYKDYPEEAWKSMDIYTEHIIKHLQNNQRINIHEVASLSIISKFFPKKYKKVCYVFRYLINPFFASFRQGEINHIVDQSNAHLLYVLDPRRTVITCHDLIVPFWQKNVGEEKELKNNRYNLKQWIKILRMNALRRAAIIICVSKFTQNELIKTLHIAKEKTVVIPNGLDSEFKRFDIKERSVFIKKHRIFYPYLLHVGTTADHKNIEDILIFFSQALKQNSLLHFIKIGESLTPSQMILAKKLQIEERIIHKNEVSRYDLRGYYSCALALVHLSHIEGFGLTVLEAMRCGCPLVLSNIPALKELAGTLGIYLSRQPVQKQTNKILSTINKPQYRSKYRLNSIKLSQQYNWSKTDESIVSVYERIFKHKL